MIVVDSSGWIEFFTGGPLAGDFARTLRHFQVDGFKESR